MLKSAAPDGACVHFHARNLLSSSVFFSHVRPPSGFDTQDDTSGMSFIVKHGGDDGSIIGVVDTPVVRKGTDNQGLLHFDFDKDARKAKVSATKIAGEARNELMPAHKFAGMPSSDGPFIDTTRNWKLTLMFNAPAIPEDAPAIPEGPKYDPATRTTAFSINQLLTSSRLKKGKRKRRGNPKSLSIQNCFKALGIKLPSRKKPGSKLTVFRGSMAFHAIAHAKRAVEEAASVAAAQPEHGQDLTELAIPHGENASGVVNDTAKPNEAMGVTADSDDDNVEDTDRIDFTNASHDAADDDDDVDDADDDDDEDWHPDNEGAFDDRPRRRRRLSHGAVARNAHAQASPERALAQDPVPTSTPAPGPQRVLNPAFTPDPPEANPAHNPVVEEQTLEQNRQHFAPLVELLHNKRNFAMTREWRETMDEVARSSLPQIRDPQQVAFIAFTYKKWTAAGFPPHESVFAVLNDALMRVASGLSLEHVTALRSCLFLNADCKAKLEIRMIRLMYAEV